MHSACVTKRLARRRKKGAQIGSIKSSASGGDGGCNAGSASTELAVCGGRLRRRPAQTSLVENDANEEGNGGGVAKSISVVAATIDRF